MESKLKINSEIQEQQKIKAPIVEALKNAHERAKNRLSKKDPNIDVKRAQLALARALARLKTIELK